MAYIMQLGLYVAHLARLGLVQSD